MFERFTDRARKVMALANGEARLFNHEYIDTGHILLGLINEDSGVGANVLINLNVNFKELRFEIDKLYKQRAGNITADRLSHTPRAKRVIEFAIEEARLFNHNYCGTEHLLLGLMRETDGIAAQTLMYMGVTLEDIRAEISALLGLELNTCHKIIIFKNSLVDIEKKLLNRLLELIINYPAFVIEPVTPNYININTKKPARIALQIHRESNGYAQLVLAIAGRRKDEPEIKNKESIVKCGIEKLAGLNDSAEENNWLRGKIETGVKGNPPYQAKVYAIKPSILQDENACAELNTLFKFAKENKGKPPAKSATK